MDLKCLNKTFNVHIEKGTLLPTIENVPINDELYLCT
jgi:hypothetical protein